MVQVNSPRADVVVDRLTAVHEATGLSVVVQDYPTVSHVRIATETLVDVVRRLRAVRRRGQGRVGADPAVDRGADRGRRRAGVRRSRRRGTRRRFACGAAER